MTNTSKKTAQWSTWFNIVRISAVQCTLSRDSRIPFSSANSPLVCPKQKAPDFRIKTRDGKENAELKKKIACVKELMRRPTTGSSE
uniref:Uncharacterized protein n=1 Tax=Caenorhabditis japonica TaxID=281687 RepID=A0A8R1IEK5_CAEJA